MKKRSRLRVDVDPDSASADHAFVVQRRVGRRWRTVTRARTSGAKDTKVLDLGRGTYRVVLPKDARGPAQASGPVRLER